MKKQKWSRDYNRDRGQTCRGH